MSGRTIGLLVILTGHNDISKRLAKKHFHSITFQEGKYLFSLFLFFRSSYYRVIFNVLIGQKRDVTELKFIWPVNPTGNIPKDFY